MPTVQISASLRQAGVNEADWHIRSVPSIVVRDQLATDNVVRVNDLVYVDATAEFYRRTASGWIQTDSTGQFVASSGTTLLYVDAGAGDDANDGLTPVTALASIQEAINRYMPPSQGPIFLASDEYLEIRVLSDVAENVVKPAHRGPGQLYIHFETELFEDDLVQSGAVATVADHLGLREISFTTSPLTPSSLQGYFISPDDDIVQAASDNVAFIAGEHSPIFDNAAGSIQCPFTNPGFIDAFSYFSTAALRIVRPQYRWDPNDLEPTSFGPMPARIVNEGGPLVIKGARFDGSGLSSLATQQTIFLDKGSMVTGSFQQSNTTCTLCTFENLTRVCDDSTNLMISSSYIDTGTDSIFIRNCTNLAMKRCVVRCDQELQFLRCTTVQYEGNYVFRTVGATNKVQFLEVTDLSAVRNDHRVDVDIRMTGTTFNISSCSFEGMGNSCIRALEGSIGFVSGCIGTAGNSDHGCQVGDLSKVTDLGGNSVAGAGGDVRLGATTGVAWGAGRTIDATTFSVFS